MEAFDEGRKDDAKKSKWRLIPWDALREVVKVLEHGAEKYGAFNWIKVEDARNRYSEAAIRHILSFWVDGERCDNGEGGSGLHTLAHAGCCVLFLLALDLRKQFEESQPQDGAPQPADLQTEVAPGTYLPKPGITFDAEAAIKAAKASVGGRGDVSPSLTARFIGKLHDSSRAFSLNGERFVSNSNTITRAELLKMSKGKGLKVDQWKDATAQWVRLQPRSVVELTGMPQFRTTK